MIFKLTNILLLISLIICSCNGESSTSSDTDLLESDFTTSITPKAPSSSSSLQPDLSSQPPDSDVPATTEASDPVSSDDGSSVSSVSEDRSSSPVTIEPVTSAPERESEVTSISSGDSSGLENDKIDGTEPVEKTETEASVREPKSKQDISGNSNNSSSSTSTSTSNPSIEPVSPQSSTTTSTSTTTPESITPESSDDHSSSTPVDESDYREEPDRSRSASSKSTTTTTTTTTTTSPSGTTSDEDEEKPLGDSGTAGNNHHGHHSDDDHSDKRADDDKIDTEKSGDNDSSSDKPSRHDKSHKLDSDNEPTSPKDTASKPGHGNDGGGDEEDSAFDNFENINVENFTVPYFEEDPIVKFFSNNDTYFSEQIENASRAAIASPPGIQFGNMMYRLFQGPDRTKLPVNSATEDVYRYIAGLVDNETGVIAKEVLPYLMELGYKTNVDGKCSKALMALSNGLKAKRTWAHKFLDSNGQTKDDGLISGTIASLGNFDQCLGIRVVDDAVLPEDRFSGRYCLAKIHPPLPPYKKDLTFRDQILNYENTELENTVYDYLGSFAHEYYSNPMALGLCVPSVCSSKDVAKVMNQIISQFNFTVTFDSRCVPETNYWEAPSPPEYAIFIFFVLALMTILGTAYDAYLRKSGENCLGRLFAAFSVISNTRNLLGKSGKDDMCSAREEKIACEKRSLSWIHGLQVIALFWLIVANVFQLGGLPITYILKNLNQDFRSQGGSIMFQFILNSWDYMAELFFLIGGFLFANSMLASHERKKAPAFGRFIIRQWLYYAPSVIAAILITLVVFQWSWSSGPIFSNAEHLIVDQCIHNGASNIMLFSNWMPTKDMCLPHTWFLSALFQLQVISFLVVLIMHKKPTIGVLISVVMVLLGVIIPGLQTYLRDLPPTMLLNNPNINQTRSDLSIQYFATYNHFSSYFIGILLGYFIFKRSLKPTMRKITRATIWIILSAKCISSILITQKWNGFEEVPNRISSTMYSALHRVAFVSLFAWLIHQFTIGSKGPFERVLSWSGFKTLSKLSLQIYLIHLILIWYYFLTTRTLIEYRNFELTIIAFGIIMLSCLAGYAIHLMVEAPFHQITAGFVKCLFGCDLKSRLREFEEDNESPLEDPIAEEKKNAQHLQQQQQQQQLQETSDNRDIRINVSAPTEENQSTNNNGVVIRL